LSCSFASAADFAVVVAADYLLVVFPAAGAAGAAGACFVTVGVAAGAWLAVAVLGLLISVDGFPFSMSMVIGWEPPEISMRTSWVPGCVA